MTHTNLGENELSFTKCLINFQLSCPIFPRQENIEDAIIKAFEDEIEE
jgi:hypothetical protein